MTTKIGVFGLDLETIIVRNDNNSVDAVIPSYIPGLAKSLTREVLDASLDPYFENNNIEFEDMGEFKMGEDYNPGLIDRRLGVLNWNYNKIKWRKMHILKRVREEILEKSKEYDLVVGLGASHLGAISLYDNNESVLRADFHADMLDFDNVCFGYASYCNWIKDNVNSDVDNIYVEHMHNDSLLGNLVDEKRDVQHLFPEHLDLDFDCFKQDYGMQDVYNSIDPKGTPETILSIIEQAKPKKLGFWEYRPYRTNNNMDTEFIMQAIKHAV